MTGSGCTPSRVDDEPLIIRTAATPTIATAARNVRSATTSEIRFAGRGAATSATRVCAWARVVDAGESAVCPDGCITGRIAVTPRPRAPMS